MLRAITKEGDFVTLAILPEHQIEHMRQKQFFCPECKNSVIVRAGPKVIPHFAHKKKTNCSYQGGESAYHQRGKLLLFHWLRHQYENVQLEVHIPEINQRPDLLMEIGKRKIAIEFQCVTISLAEIKKRNLGYQQANITPIWILGANQFKRISYTHLQINDFTLQFVHQFSPNLPTTLFYFCPQSKEFSIINDVYPASTKRAIAKITFRKLHQLHFKSLFSMDPFYPRNLFTIWKKEKSKFRLKRSQAYGKELKWRYWLYDKGLHHETLPSIVYLPIPSQQRMNVPLWNWQSRFIIDFLHLQPRGKSFTLSEAKKFLRPFTYQSDHFPLLSIQANPIVEYLNLLKEIKIIHEVRKHHYIKRKAIHCYKRIDEAIIGDNELLNRFMYNQRQE